MTPAAGALECAGPGIERKKHDFGIRYFGVCLASVYEMAIAIQEVAGKDYVALLHLISKKSFTHENIFQQSLES